MQVFLKASDVNVEPEHFRRKWMLAAKFLRAMNPTLPGEDCPSADYQPSRRLRATQESRAQLFKITFFTFQH